ncbi:MAG: pectate lyase [Prevotella sp.]|nr:pectate lyase [Prevotella sp.]
MKKLYAILFLFCGLLMTGGMAMAQEKTPAFPGAEGFGRYVTGGRGGKVIHVTNLNNSGMGSLRWALNQTGTRTIVFDVSGTIHLTSALSVSNGNVTIAGQTAPGDGICVADYPFSIAANNVIVRYMRFRLGNNNVTLDGADGWDGLGAMDQKNIIIDHCSVSWSIDECLSVYGCENTTVQWCLVTQSLKNAGHSKGAHGYGGNWGGSGASFHHNLMAHHESREPRLGPRYTTQLDERMDMRNNVFYNWGGNGCYGGEAMHVNIVNNYYKPGPRTMQLSTTKRKRIASIGIRTNSYIASYPDYAPTLHMWGTYFVDGNVNEKYSDVTNDNWTYGMYNQIDASGNDGLYTEDVKEQIRLSAPIDFIYTTTHSAEKAYEKVLQYVGACLHRDSYDALMLNDVENGVATYGTKGIIDSQNDNKPADAGDDWSAWPTLESEAAPADSDGDGMPDTWENANGLDANDANDGAIVCADGYTNLENYLNSLVASITENEYAGGEVMGSIIEEGGEVAKSSYEISPATHETGWTFENGFSISCNKEYAEGNSCGMKGIKYSRNSKYTINIPDGISIVKVDFTGFSNVNEESAFLGELGGTSFGETDYVFPSRSGGEYVTHSIELPSPVAGALTFTPKGQQVVWNITLYTPASTGIAEVNTSVTRRCDLYTIDGRLVKSGAREDDLEGLPKGIYILGGKKVVKR